MKYIVSNSLSAVDNMLLDSFLTLCTNDSYFRLYRWEKATLSLGVKNSLDELNLDSVKKYGIDVVYRESGGGIIYHNSDVCFSFIGNLDLKPKENYNYVKRIIETILKKLGANITITNEKNLSSFICFNGSSKYEISVDNKKVVGIAQKIIKSRYLIQGSIQLKESNLSSFVQEDITQFGLESFEYKKIEEMFLKYLNNLVFMEEIKEDEIIKNSSYKEFKKKNLNRFYVKDLDE